MTARQHFSTILNDMDDIVYNHPYHAFALLAIMIEVLGKCLSSQKWQQDGQSSTDFKKAIEEYPSLQQYKAIPDLYHILRCGMAHALLVKPGVKLVPKENNISLHIIGCADLYRDILHAWDDLNEMKVDTLRNLDEEVLSIKDEASGSTETKSYV